MRVLTIAKEMGPGGTERAAQNCTLAYRAAGHSTAVLSIDKGGSRGDELAALGIPVWIGGYSEPEVDRALAQAVAWQPTLVHIHGTGATDLSSSRVLHRLRAGSAARLPVIETNHFGRCDRSKDRDLIDLHLHMTEWCLWKWQQWSRGLRPMPLGVVLPHMVDTKAFYRVDAAQRDARRAMLRIPKNAFAFGRLGQPFGFGWSPIIFDAFERFAPAHPDAVLVVIGLPDSLRPRMDALPKALRSRVLDHPFVHGDQNLRECYSALDCFLHAKQIGESFGYVLTESMLCGCPVISLSTPTRDNSQTEVVGHRRGGLIVTDVTSMEQAMRELHGNPTTRERLGVQGGAWVREHFASEVVAERLLKLAEIVVAEGSRDRLRDRLVSEGFLMSVSKQRIRELMCDVLGKNRPLTRTIMRLGHHPSLYAGFSRFKGVLQRKLRR